MTRELNRMLKQEGLYRLSSLKRSLDNLVRKLEAGKAVNMMENYGQEGLRTIKDKYPPEKCAEGYGEACKAFKTVEEKICTMV